MRLSTRSRLGIIAMLYLADNDRNPVNAGTLSRELQVSVSYLEQLFARLRFTGFVTGVRGPSGGYKLAVGAGNISIAQIILAIDQKACGVNLNEEVELNSHTTGPQAETPAYRIPQLPRSPAKGVDVLWGKLSARIYNHLDSISLADVINWQDDETKPPQFM